MSPAGSRSASATRPRRPGRWPLLLAVLLVAGLALVWNTIRARAIAGASYGAHVSCSCRFIAGRDLADCRKDFEPGMGLITLSEDVDAKSVTARFPLLSTQTATWREGLGCQLEPWRD